MDNTTAALATGGLSLLMPGGGLFGGKDNSAKKAAMMKMAMIAQNTKAAEKDYAPYTTGGQSAQEQMMAQLGLGGPAKAFDVTQLPGYQNALTQGLNAVNQGGAGAGMLMSGERLKGLQSTGQNIFGDYYNNYMSRLTGMSQAGQSAVGNLANIRTGGMTQTLGAMGDYQAQKAQQKAQQGAMFGDILGMAGTGLGMMFGGPAGAAVGGSIGSSLGGGMGGGGAPSYPTGAMKMAGIDF
jgi:hypothetical protein